MKKHIEEEIEALSYNLDVVTKKLHSGTLSAVGTVAAKETAKTLKKIKAFIANDNSKQNRVELIVSHLPLLYFHIPKLS